MSCDVSLYFEQNFCHPQLVLNQEQLTAIACHVLSFFPKNAYELSVVCVDSQESQTLNRTYRQKDKPTNVLSFVPDIEPFVLQSLDCVPLGDLVICVPVVLQEAQEQQKMPLAHFSHLMVHGILHLLGYDHETGEEQAQQMEQLEINILQGLGINNPYQDDLC